MTPVILLSQMIQRNFLFTHICTNIAHLCHYPIKVKWHWLFVEKKNHWLSVLVNSPNSCYAANFNSICNRQLASCICTLQLVMSIDLFFMLCVTRVDRCWLSFDCWPFWLFSCLFGLLMCCRQRCLYTLFHMNDLLNHQYSLLTFFWCGLNHIIHLYLKSVLCKIVNFSIWLIQVNQHLILTVVIQVNQLNKVHLYYYVNIILSFLQ